ncbi:DUF2442 domain-containing protein [bacterium]|nr:DUF2442 domain-containing protein [bacterium]
MNIPRIESVTALPEWRLLVIFTNGFKKIYDCNKIMNLERFQLLRHDAFFKAVKVDLGGYGISWDDERDLSEYELWTNGAEVEQETWIKQNVVVQNGERG